MDHPLLKITLLLKQNWNHKWNSRFILPIVSSPLKSKFSFFSPFHSELCLHIHFFGITAIISKCMENHKSVPILSEDMFSLSPPANHWQPGPEIQLPTAFSVLIQTYMRNHIEKWSRALTVIQIKILAQLLATVCPHTSLGLSIFFL